MADDLLPPVPPAVPPLPAKQIRPPVPGWMWLLFGLGMVPVGLLLCLANLSGNSGNLLQVAVAGGGGGLLCGLPLLGGLALSVRFFSSTSGRILGGLMFAGLLLVGLGAVFFAGCMCLMTQNGSFR